MSRDDSMANGHDKRCRSPQYRELLRAHRPSEVFLRETGSTRHEPEPEQPELDEALQPRTDR